ncbi:hypothetical protein [Kitasatospora sp. NPDC093806]|uniref:hypothetical protein n=1 Tax=Kitasatospora sp. NPDC093806 TaxID=3155075 RepID=UPI0034279A63
MGIFDRFRHRAPHAAEEAAAQRAALAHDEAADAFSVEAEKAREARESAAISEQEAEERARADMTAEGDPWG